MVIAFYLWVRGNRFWQELEAKIERGELQFRVRSLEGDRLLKRIHLAIKSLIYPTFRTTQ